MAPERIPYAVSVAVPLDPRQASGWTSWAPDAEHAADLPGEPVGLLGGVLSLLMWGCASLMAVWYL